ncbi:hypothetical protein GY45DRAFT_1339166 [Cubamyces sp. BRFM 1775]|nr:hypothetical protein GY45DRAFT_1339166 [Cubamyces sp. BRFM 1775]
MDTLPLEILQRIFTFACTDGGHAGVALSLTSKSIRAASRTARFRSIALIANPRRLESFLALYERECEAAASNGVDKPRIRHLYVTFPRVEPRRRYYSPSFSPRRRTKAQPDTEESSKDSVRKDPRPSESSRAEEDDRLPRPSRGRSTINDPSLSVTYHDAARRFFQLVAPELWTLVIQVGFRYGGGLHIPLFTAPFPALREFTLIELLRPEWLFGAIDVSSTGPVFPTVTHLHLLPHELEREFQLDLWTTHVPHLTHLRVSGRSSGIIDELTLAVGAAPAPSLPPKFSGVRCLLIQPSPLPAPDGFCGTPLEEYDMALCQLEAFVKMCRDAGLEAAIVPACQEWFRAGVHRLREDWLNGEEHTWVDGPVS